MSRRAALAASLLACLALLAAGAPAQAAEPVDLVVAGDWVVTMDGQGRVIEDGAVAISDGEILAVGTREAVLAAWAPARFIPGTGRILLPGLVNGHTHAAMSLFRGIADDRDLMDWLENFIFPLENRFVDEEFVRIGTELACQEMIAGGTTTFADMYFFPDVVARVVRACGLRAVVGVAMIEQPSPHSPGGWDENLALADAFVTEWRGRHRRITPAYAPHAPYTVGPGKLQAVRARANRAGVPLMTHIAETRWEVEEVRKRYRRTPVAHLDAAGVLAGPTIGAHLVWPQDAEIAVLAARGTGAVHNPTSNLKLASGISPVPQMLAAGVDVGLGTDGAASNNDLDLWEEIRLAALIHKAELADPKVMPAATVLRMATAGGAAALGLQEQVGSLAPGLRADLIQVRVAYVPHLTPMYSPVSHLVYAADAQDVVTTVVDGRVLMEEGRVLTLDAERVMAEARAVAERIRAMLASEPDSP